MFVSARYHNSNLALIVDGSCQRQCSTSTHRRHIDELLPNARRGIVRQGIISPPNVPIITQEKLPFRQKFDCQT